MASLRTYIVLFFGCCLLLGCKKHAHHSVVRGIYYWKTVFKPTSFELRTLNQLHISRLYVRFFDVEYDAQAGRPYPVAPIRFADTAYHSFEVVPVVFLTQSALPQLTVPSVTELADRISALVESLCNGARIAPNEIQIDCDWTAGTRDAYFLLLTRLQQQAFLKGKLLSCTLRMHQVKYTASCGIPPVDRCMLMCYSMGDLKKFGALNSILDAGAARSYLSGLGSYPLPTDMALPAFRWCVLFRDKMFQGILRDLPPDAVTGSALFEHRNGNLYGCLRDTLYHGYSLQSGDVVRVEQPEPDALRQVADFTAERVQNPSMNVLLFSCDSLILSKFPNHEMEDLYNRYR